MMCSVVKQVRKVALSKECHVLGMEKSPLLAVVLLASGIACAAAVAEPRRPQFLAVVPQQLLPQPYDGSCGDDEKTCEKALRFNETFVGKDHPAVARVLVEWAELQVGNRKFHEAERLLRRALTIQETSLGSDHPDVIVTRKHLARVYQETGSHVQAVQLLQSVLMSQEAGTGSNRSETIAQALTELAEAQLARGNPGEAEPLLRRALALYEASSDHKAEPFLWRMIGVSEMDNAPQNYGRLSGAWTALAKVDRARGSMRQAELSEARAKAFAQATQDYSSPELLAAMAALASYYEESGAYSRAAPMLRGLVYHTRNQPQLIAARCHLAQNYRIRGQYFRAEVLLKQALTEGVQDGAAVDTRPETRKDSLLPELAKVKLELGKLYFEEAAYGESETFLKSALAIREAMPAKNPRELAASLRELADLYIAQGALEKAEPLLRRALATLESEAMPAPGRSSPEVGLTLSSLATLSAVQGGTAKPNPCCVGRWSF